MDLKGKNILITGASKGLGKATAEMLIKAGANVAITARSSEKLFQTAKEIGAFPIQGDVSIEADVDRIYAVFLAKFGRIDALVNNAGLANGHKSIFDTNLSDWQFVFGINLFGAAMMGKKAATYFKNQNYGNIINIGSTAALKGFANGSVYAASKFAVRGMSDCWREELRKYNIRVVLINPTYVPTAFGTADGIEKPLENKYVKPTDIAYAIKSALEMDDSAFITELTVWATNPF